MCFFPSSNLNKESPAYKAGIKQFKCGACPECLQERSASWALRAVYEARSHVYSCMVTLTYDTFKYDSSGQIIGENPVNPDLKVNKSHVQKFFKRLRKHFSNQRIKYIACAEYGSHTHRAHYHCILFGVRFNDAHFYKRSKRGNPIYMSSILTKLWSHGICTVDSINVHTAVARYCTKYCAKSRSEETFMLFSKGLGINELMKDFNGKSYFIDGREYPVPRQVWNRYISEKYKHFQVPFSFKYQNHDYSILDSSQDFLYLKFKHLRENYRMIRDRDDVYVGYIQYWRKKSKIYDSLRDSVIHRIYALPENKFHAYKTKALECYGVRRQGVPLISPGSNCKSVYFKYLISKGCFLTVSNLEKPFAASSRPNTANDTTNSKVPIITEFVPSFTPV